MDAVVRAARQHGKLSVTVGFGAEMLTACVKTGFNLIVSGGDVPFLANTSKQVSAEARALVAGATTGPAGAQSPA
jgi:2-keto-3-deoxy-L-rhamnonate aldolase RhmA